MVVNEEEEEEEGGGGGRNAWNDGIQFLAGGESEARWLAEPWSNDVSIYYDNEDYVISSDASRLRAVDWGSEAFI